MGFWQTRCQNRLKVTSIYAAAEVYCDEDERKAGFAQLDKSCRSSANVELLPRKTVVENLTEEKIKQMEIVEYLAIPRSEVLGSPVLISSAYYDRVFRTIVRDIVNHNGENKRDNTNTENCSRIPGRLKCGLTTLSGEPYSRIYVPHIAKARHSYLGYFYWGCILSFGICYRLTRHMLGSRKYTKKHGRFLSHAYKGFNCLYQWAYTHLIIAFPLKISHRRVLWFDLPTRIDAILIAGFWMLSVIFTGTTYRLYDDNI